MRLGNTFFDPYVAILDAKPLRAGGQRRRGAGRAGRRAPRSSPRPTASTSSRSARAPTAATAPATYRLHVGTFPRPTAVVPAGGKPGEDVEVTLPRRPGRRDQAEGDSCPPTPTAKLRRRTPRTPAASPRRACRSASATCANVDRGRAERRRRQGHGRGRGPRRVQRRHREGRATSTTSSSRRRRGRCSTSTCYARAAPLAARPGPVRSATPSGGGVVGNDDSGGPDSYFRFTVPDDGEYVAQRHRPPRQGRRRTTSTASRSRRSQPTLDDGASRRSQQYSQDRQTIAVPQGQPHGDAGQRRAAANFGGDVNVEVGGLPAGRDASSTDRRWPANESQVPGRVRGRRRTPPPAGALADLTGKHGRPQDGRSTGDLVAARPGWSSGQNNSHVLGLHGRPHGAWRVTEEAPFTIEIVEPKVPLVQNGSMNLKVVAKRKPGFKAPITVRMLYNPPGVGSAGAVDDPAKARTRSLLPMNANGGAPSRRSGRPP